jgi:site-specific DNA recombinase
VLTRDARVESDGEDRRSTRSHYACFATDLQIERSIEDQLSRHSKYAERENLEIISVFDERARSGGSIRKRDSLLALMDKALQRLFDGAPTRRLKR